MDREQTAFALESELPLLSPTGGFSAMPGLYLSKSLEMCSIFSTYLDSFYNLTSLTANLLYGFSLFIVTILAWPLVIFLLVPQEHFHGLSSFSPPVQPKPTSMPSFLKFWSFNNTTQKPSIVCPQANSDLKAQAFTRMNICLSFPGMAPGYFCCPKVTIVP